MIHGKYETWQVAAGQDLSACLFKAVTVGGTIAANASTALGILVTKGSTGEHVGVAVSGVVKGWAGGAISAGAAVTITTSGFFTAAGSNGVPVGKALETCASGDLFPALVNFANASIAT